VGSHPAEVRGFLDALPACLPEENLEPGTDNGLSRHDPSAQVNYVGKGVNLYGLGYRITVRPMSITRHLRNGGCGKIRLQGGAYGAFCFFDKHSGALTCLLSRSEPA